MSQERVQRRLAAILFADVVGYSRLIGRDDVGTWRRLQSVLRDVVRPRVKAHAGRVVRIKGDGILVEFASAVEAVASAVALQQAMAQRNAILADAHHIELRIGISLGDIITDDDDVQGDGVNVAARLEPLAEPGGICLSATVHEHVRAKLAYPFEDRGVQTLKNIADPVRIYALGPKKIAGLPSDTPSSVKPKNGWGWYAAAIAVGSVCAAALWMVWPDLAPPTVQVTGTQTALPGTPAASVAEPAARAPQSTMPMIGFLSSRSPSESAGVVAAFHQGLREAGFVEGQNLAIAFRWAEGRYDRLPALAANLVDLRVAVLLAAGGPPSVLAAKTATSTIPIVFSAANDPVRLGLVASLNRPRGNVTGMSTLTTELAAKCVEILNEMVPKANAIAYLVNPSNPSADGESKEALAAARALGLQLHVLGASTEHDLDGAFATLVKLRAGALGVAGEPFFDSQRDRLVALSARHAIPASYAWREYVLAGGLMSYGTSLTDSYRQAGIYVGRVLKGEKPADLPVMQPIKFHLALNLKTAKALGIAVPPTLLARADEVIE